MSTLGTFGSTDLRKMMVVNLNRLEPYEGRAQDERPSGGSSGSSCRVITLRSEPRWGKMIPIIDVTSTALEKEEMAVHL
jgi:hypothetical protein